MQQFELSCLPTELDQIRKTISDQLYTTRSSDHGYIRRSEGHEGLQDRF